jgi:hypothetical protein
MATNRSSRSGSALAALHDRIRAGRGSALTPLNHVFSSNSGAYSVNPKAWNRPSSWRRASAP